VSAPAGPARRGFRPDVEGLRAVAILLVAGYHARVPGMTGGYVGVDVFFVLSGYLITGLLVREAEATGTVGLVQFYARRARRLLPALLVVAGTTAVVGAVVFAPAEQVHLARTALATVAYVSNVHFARGRTDYLGAATETNPFLHTWSLSVEEQFYVVWPLFVLFGLGVLGRRGRTPNVRRLLAWMTVAAALSFALCVVWTGTRQPWAFFLSPPRAWEFALGALAVLAARPLGRADHALGWIGLVGVLAAAVLFGATTPFPGAAALLPAVSTVLLLRAGAADPDGPLARLLGWRPFQEVGRLSYSWYLWHWPALVIGAALVPDLPLAARLGLLVLSLGLAEVSYRFVEEPVRRSPGLARRPGLSLAVTVAATVVGVGLALAWSALAGGASRGPEQRRFTEAGDDLPAVYASGCHADFYAVEADGCVSGAARATRTAVLLGDSHAAQWHPALDTLARAHGWRLVSLTKSDCPAVDVPVYSAFVGRTYTECAAWRGSALDAVARLRPDLVVVTSEAEGIGAAAWTDGMPRVLADLSATARRVVLLRDTPVAPFDVPTCLARNAWRPLALASGSCAFASGGQGADVWEAQRRAAAPFENVVAVDLTGLVCPGGACRPEQAGRITYRDAHHLTAGYVRALAPAFGRQVGMAEVRP
jgi:peptidoglycan/LPS O-acetylase OafA/YrhL